MGEVKEVDTMYLDFHRGSDIHTSKVKKYGLNIITIRLLHKWLKNHSYRVMVHYSRERQNNREKKMNAEHKKLKGKNREKKDLACGPYLICLSAFSSLPYLPLRCLPLPCLLCAKHINYPCHPWHICIG